MEFKINNTLHIDFSIKNNEINSLLEKYFISCEANYDKNDIIYVTDEYKSSSEYIQSGKTKIYRNGFFHQGKNICIGLEQNNEKDTIFINSIKASFIHDFKRNIYKKLIGSRPTHIENFFSYSALWSLLHVALCHKNHAFVHSSSVSMDDEACLIIGTGGSGKTSTTIALVEEYGYRYQSEDFSIIDQKGYSSFSPRPLTIYSSDVERGSQTLKKYTENFNLRKKIIWRILKSLKLNPRDRAVANRIFRDNQINYEKTKIRKAYFLVRKNIDKPSFENIEPEKFVSQSVYASLREVLPLFEPFSQIGATTGHGSIFNVEYIIENTKAIYRSAFSDVECKVLNLPLRLDSSSIAKIIHEDF